MRMWSVCSTLVHVVSCKNEYRRFFFGGGGGGGGGDFRV